jgi:GNAT superfamily N-acetyltransferase
VKRVPGLRDLSDDHHTGLVLARRCRQAAAARSAAAVEQVWKQVLDAFALHLEPHFRIEEEHLLPALEAIGEPALARRIRDDHAALRALEHEPPDAGRIERFGRLLEAHIRYEERQVFGPTQSRLPPDALRAIASACASTPRAYALSVPAPDRARIAQTLDVEVVPFREEHQHEVVALILEIQRSEFGMSITAAQQPDLMQIPGFYQVRNGNFWVALSGTHVVGTISLLDIGAGQAALRKMFVRRDFRGRARGTAQRLLDSLLGWCRDRAVREIYLGTTPHFLAAHRFYEKNGFREIATSDLPRAFPIMEVDTKFYFRSLEASA